MFGMRNAVYKVIEKVEDRLSRIFPFLHWKNLATSAMHGYIILAY